MRTPYKKRELKKDFGDKRLDDRFSLICSQIESNLLGTLPEVGKSKSATKAMYRFFENKTVLPQKMLSNHFDKLDKVFSSPQLQRFLQLNDSSELDYTGKKGGLQMGPLNFPNRRGCLLHNSLILSEQGAPIGLLEQTYHIRKDEDFGKSKERKKIVFEKKESYRWKAHFEKGQALCQSNESLEGIFIADREADIMELFQARTCERMQFIIRSKHNRKLVDRPLNLHDHISKSPVQGNYQIKIPHPKTKKERKAKLEVRFAKVQIQLDSPVAVKKGLPPFPIYVVQTKEINPPLGIDQPVHWILLTTISVENFEQAISIIQFYVKRWIIERFHYLLKSGGANVEDLQLQTPHRLKNAITAYSIAVLNVFKIKYWAENSPQTSIYQIGISTIEHQVLYTYAQKHISPKIQFHANDPPNIEHFCIVLGQIGGFIPSKRQPIPGLKIISRAITKLNTLVDAYLTFFQ